MKALINCNIYDFHSFKEDCYIIYDKEIIEVGSMLDFKGATEIIDCQHAMVMPGLIIGHGHIYSAFVRGLSFPFTPSTFTQLLQQLWWRLDAGIDLESTYHSAKVYGIEHIKSGVTTLIDHHASGTSIRGTLNELKRGFCDELGLRGIFCFETSDRFNVDECIAENLDFARNNYSAKCRGMLGMHASLSVSQETLEKIATVKGDIPIHVHVGESLEDEVESLNKYGTRIVQRFDSFGLLSKDSLLAHCVNIDESEAEIIAERGCTVAVNPTSNMNTSVGLPNYQLLKRHNIQTIIGNDSLGTNITRDYQNMLYTMHLKSKSAWQFSYNDLLTCIRNVYDYTGKMLGIKIGKIEPGYVADLITVPYKVPTILSEGNVFAYMVDGLFNHFHPREVLIGGELKMKNYTTIWDEEEIYVKASKAAKKLWSRIGGI